MNYFHFGNSLTTEIIAVIELVQKLHKFTKENNGKTSALEAKLKAESEYAKYKVIQDKNYISDFDKLLSEIKE